MKNRYQYITKDLLFGLGFHLGQLRDKWKPSMRFYIDGNREDFHVMDVDKSLLLFRNAFRFVQKATNFKKPGIVFSALNYDKILEQEKGLINFTNLPSNLVVFNHRISGVLTNFKRVKKQYAFTNGEKLRLSRNFFPSFGIALTRPLPYSLISEFVFLSVPLVALVDNNTEGVDRIMFPIISSEWSQKFAFIILRAALKGLRVNFVLKRLRDETLYARRHKYLFNNLYSYFSERFRRSALPLSVYKKSWRRLNFYKKAGFRFLKKRIRKFFFFKARGKEEIKERVKLLIKRRPRLLRNVYGFVALERFRKQARQCWTVPGYRKRRSMVNNYEILIENRQRRYILEKKYKNKRRKWVRFKGRRKNIKI